MIYIDSELEEELREALRQGQSIVDLSDRLRIDAEFLSRLLGIPVALAAVPTHSDDDHGYLWRSDQLNNLL